MKLWTALLVGVLATGAAQAAGNRIVKIPYNPDQVVKVQGHYRYATVIEFGNDETVQGAVLGDSSAWEATPSRNMLFLKPVLENAATNMTVMTNKRSYTFDLDAKGGYVESPEEAVFRIKFTYPGETKQQAEALFVNGDANRAVSPDKLNFDYSYVGSSSLKPKRMFDDGEFTYIQFEKSTDYPAVFKVNKKGKESLVNFAVKGQYLVVPTVTARYTLRDGDEVTCLFNEPLFSKWDNKDE